MRLSSTQIFEGYVQLRFEGDLSDGSPIEWIDIQVKHMADECQPLAVTKRAVLDRAQRVIKTENDRLRSLE